MIDHQVVPQGMLVADLDLLSVRADASDRLVVFLQELVLFGAVHKYAVSDSSRAN